MRILQFGKTGQVGLEILVRAASRGHTVTALGRDTIDLGQPSRVGRAFSSAGAVDVVINGAAYTQVDKAESEPDKAFAVNGESVGVLAEICAKRNIPMIQLSTDYVFDGTKPSPYLETDTPEPLNVYGRSKLMGETLLRARHAQHIILRTSWVYSAHGTNFVRTMLKLGAERDELKIVDDQTGAPTSAADIADTCLALCDAIAARGASTPWGTYHYAASGVTTWRHFAEAIFERARGWAGIKARIVPITTEEYGAKAKRPLNSQLNCTKLKNEFGLTGRPWQDGLNEVLASLRPAQEAAR